MSFPNEPSADECNRGARLPDHDGMKCYAAWYPQMGGYPGKAVIAFHPGEPDGCFEAYVWHDGEFPFAEDREPARLHHCSSAQFVEFGDFVSRAQSGEAT